MDSKMIGVIRRRTRLSGVEQEPTRDELYSLYWKDRGSLERMAVMFGFRGAGSIQRRMIRLGIKRREHNIPWHNEELETLKVTYGERSRNELAETVLRRHTAVSIQTMARRLDLTKARSWLDCRKRAAARGRLLKLEELVPYLNLAERDAAFLAGLFEGEGCIYMGWTRLNKRDRDRKVRRSITLDISNTQIDLLNKIHEITKLGKVSVRRRPDRPMHQPIGIWRVNGMISAYAFARAILPYLVSTRNRARVQNLMDYCKYRFSGGVEAREEEIILRVKELNHRGGTTPL